MLVERNGTGRSRQADFAFLRNRFGHAPSIHSIVGCATAIAVAPLLYAAPLGPGLPSDYFPIATFYQPANAVATTNFAGWKGRGVNTLIGYETQGGEISIDDYTTAAANAGLKIIREPTSSPATDNAPNLVGWLQTDEPDLKDIDPSILNAIYGSLKAANPNRPVLINFAGAFMVPGFAPLRTQAYYMPYIQAGDWVAQDLYPVTGWNQPNAIGAVGQATGTLRGWSNKPTFAFIETSNQRLQSNSTPEALERGPTPSEVRAEIWDAVIHGARGIAYFPQQINGFRYDATPIDVAAEMTRQDAAITGLAPALTSDATPDVTTVNFTNPAIEYVTRSFGGITYVIALNLTNGVVVTDFSAGFSMAASGLAILGGTDILTPNSLNIYSDAFGPYQVRIYAEGAPGAVPLAIPEPSGIAFVSTTALLLARRRRNRVAPAVCTR